MRPQRGDLDSAPRVLVVDDDSQLARTLARALAHLGIDVSVAEGGPHALECLQARRFDVLLLDLRMPGMDGIDLLRCASGHPNFPQTIMHSAHMDVQTTVEAMRAGATEVLQKPISAHDLAARIKTLTASRTPPTRKSSGVVEVQKKLPSDTPLLLGTSAPMMQLKEAVRRVVRFRDLAVLIEGPTGTGKELVAQSIHQLSAVDQPMVSVNCAAIPAELFESELFGHDTGAFTSARAARAGLLEEAGDGTLFLDEVGELPMGLQAKLLRVLETREFRRVGSNRVRRFSARLVSATNRRLAVESGEAFRSDLYFRIAGHTLRTVALRDHATDIPMLAEHFCRSFCEQNDMPRVEISDDAMQALCAFDWPGNVRQLRIVIQDAVVHAHGNQVDLQQIASVLDHAAGPRLPKRRPAGEFPVSRPLPDMQRDLILGAYQESGNNLSRAAEALGIPRTTLRDRLKRYGVR